ncbi:MAG TPA: hypothetical protein VHL98_02180 [Microvirga sp.]|jgi:hypothetical protein|nr:hypothetical protein [Microvirga sp.]
MPGQPVPGDYVPEMTDAPLAPAAPAPPKPVPAKTASEASVLGRQLRLNGQDGSLRLERSGRDEWRARISLAGTRISRPGEACTVEPAEALPVSLRGRPDGLMRFEIDVPSCPIAASLLDGALWVREPAGLCQIEASDCRVNPRGVWGPEPAALVPLARTIETDRGIADRTVRENYKVMTQRAAPGEVRPIVSEQASFSADRETVCRNYRGEATHGFCNARFTEGRAAQLAARLGIAPAPVPTASAVPPGGAIPPGGPIPPVQRRLAPPAGAPMPLGPQAQ